MQSIALRRSTRYFGQIKLWALACIVVGILPIAAHGQNREASTDCGGEVDGHVVDKDSHEPIAGASVYLDGVIVGLTDSDGRFVLKKLCQSAVVLEVERADYKRASREIEIKGTVSSEFVLDVNSGEVVLMQGDISISSGMQSKAVLDGEALERTRGKSFSDALANVPGVRKLGSASGMAKPIVRGQFGRRLLLLVDSIPLRSQEWGLDHAPEIDPFSAGEIQVVRGAAGVRYGPSAIGGAVIVNPPKLLRTPGWAAETHLLGFLTRGAGLASRVQIAPPSIPGLAYQVQGTVKRLAASQTPEYALQNTGLLEWNAGATAGYTRGKTEFTLSYRHYQSMLGVCACLKIESSEDFFAQVQRGKPVNSELFEPSFTVDRPFQSVGHDQVLARVKTAIGSFASGIATYSLQFDHRSEFDVVRNALGPQFDFLLTSHDLDFVVQHQPIHLNNHIHLRGSAGLVGSAQIHSYRGLPLIPSYQSAGSGAFVIERLQGHDFEIEVGLRYDVLARQAEFFRGDFLRLIRSEQLAADACKDGEGDTVLCDSFFHMASVSAGGLLQLTEPWSLKLDLSTSSRPPNPDEQYLNGTSPTFPVLGLGKPDLEPETTYSASLTSSYAGERVAVEASIYGNVIADYIYFAPAIAADGTPIFDVLIRGSYPRFITRPVDALFYGADGGVVAKVTNSLELGAQVSMVRARNLSDDSFLTLVPSDRARGYGRYTFTSQTALEKFYASLGVTAVARQNRFDPAADLVSPPKGYALLDAELGGQTPWGNRTLKFSIQGSNLLNTRYRDYTSLLRYFADQPGVQVMSRLSVLFGPSHQ